MSLKLIGLQVSNYQKIKLVKINVGPGVTNIVGDNEAGKTSLLDAIQVCLVGKNALPPVPVRVGEDMAEIILDCDEVTVTRRIKPDRTGTLKVESKDGLRPTSPQAWLDARIGAISFDPLSFMRLDPKPQAETLRKLVGVDTSDIDLMRPKLYERRTETNRDLKAAQAKAASLPPADEAIPASEVSITDITKRQTEAYQAQTKRQKLASAIATHQAGLNRTREEAESLDLEIRLEAANLPGEIAKRQASVDEEIQALESRIAALRIKRAKLADEITDEHNANMNGLRASLDKSYGDIDNTNAAIERLTNELNAIPNLDPTAIGAEFDEAAETNRKVRANNERKTADAKVAELAEASANLTSKLDELDAERANRIKSASYPVPGLGFDDNGLVTFDGLPLSQASMAGKIRVSMAIGIAMNPALRLVLIRDAALLDDKSMAIVREMAEKHDVQVFLERINKAEMGAIVIEDGEVAS